MSDGGSGVGRAGSGVSARRRVGADEQRGTFLQESCLVRSAAQSLAPTTVPSAIRTPRARARDCSARGRQQQKRLTLAAVANHSVPFIARAHLNASRAHAAFAVKRARVRTFRKGLRDYRAQQQCEVPHLSTDSTDTRNREERQFRLPPTHCWGCAQDLNSSSSGFSTIGDNSRIEFTIGDTPVHDWRQSSGSSRLETILGLSSRLETLQSTIGDKVQGVHDWRQMLPRLK